MKARPRKKIRRMFKKAVSPKLSKRLSRPLPLLIEIRNVNNLRTYMLSAGLKCSALTRYAQYLSLTDPDCHPLSTWDEYKTRYKGS